MKINSYPMRWPCGPLEVALRRRGTTSLPDEVQVNLLRWMAPGSLELLKDTPINCLIVPWAAGLPEDEEQQRGLQPLLASARTLGVQVVGRVQTPADPKKAATCGHALGLFALALPSLPTTELDLPVVEWAERDRINWNGSSIAVAVSDAVWPGIRGKAGRNGAPAVAGPTGIPWLDSNGWLAQLARQRCESKSVWLAFEPEQMEFALEAESYLLALADAEASGARWIVSLDDRFRSELSGGLAVALEHWKQITAAIAFFRSRSTWNEFGPKAALGIAAGNSEALGFTQGEILNLLNRRQVPFRILGKGWKAEETRDLVAILCADTDPPSATERVLLLKFAEQGGLLIVPDIWKRPDGAVVSHDLEGAYALHRIGRGRVACAREAWQDPYRVAEEVHLLMSRRNDLFRLGNGASLIVYCSGSADGRMTVLHLVNFDRRARPAPASLWVKQHFRKARFWNLGSNEPLVLSTGAVAHGWEMALPPFTTYGAVELES